MSKKLWISIALASVMVVTAACGANTGKANTNSGSDASNASGETEKSYTIAISQIVEHPSLDATREGFIAALNDAGIEEGKNLKIDFNNAQGDATNIKTISQKIANSKSDLALGIATPTAQALADDVKNIPVLFAAVTDPIDAGIVTQLEAPGGNITGASDTNPDAIKQTMDFIATQIPNVKNVGLIINEGEQNAVVMGDIAETALEKHGIKLIKASIANSSDVKQAADSLVGRVDAIYITLDNMVVTGADAIIEVANANDIPFFSADRDTVEKGAFAAVGFKYYDHGYEVGQMAVEILKNGKNPGEMDVTVPQKLDFIFNMKAAAEQGITVTDDMKAFVKDQANNIIE
ncbi:sugar ABC transporter substrate-binding protein [Paenibacillus sp. FSL H8-0548]|uniref:ABC transporter substrate-binding protein n=1 Tax=Paenibacillus sp. FSL H8-0548 TaxID=1920422 RepID=UPI00096D385F|nr:ABC transporter substrate-binding protein [Paenibacillus sp. FSL H8-0548]OMF23750.1 sugar ABC transporter substrate-binding protein [Paenibacillus sp. FSL H8-0548]